MTMPPVPPQPQIIYQTVVRPRTNGLAITAVIIGPIALFFAAFVPIPILGFILLFIAVPCTAAAITLGHLGLRVANRIDVGRTPAVIGLISGYLSAAIIAIATIFWAVAVIAAFSQSGS